MRVTRQDLHGILQVNTVNTLVRSVVFSCCFFFFFFFYVCLILFINLSDVFGVRSTSVISDTCYCIVDVTLCVVLPPAEHAHVVNLY